MFETPYGPIKLDCPAAWSGSDIADDTRWQFRFEPVELDELDDALVHAKCSKQKLSELSPLVFPLKEIRWKLQSIAEELEQGCGFVRLEGLPLSRWNEDDLKLIWMGLASYLGQPVFQDANGQLLREIRAETGDVGQRYGQLSAFNGQFLSSRARTASNAELRYHTDRSDIVGLLCTGVAKQGGLSKIASSVKVHNEMLQRFPKLCALLYENLPRSRIGEEQGGDKAWYQLPVWAVRDGHFTSHYSRTFVEALAHVTGAPTVTSDQWQALDALALLAEEQHYAMELAEGDIQFLNNHVIYHSRTAFEDDAESGLLRCLWRIWLSAPHRPLPAGHAVLWREVEAGKIRGGIGVEPL